MRTPKLYEEHFVKKKDDRAGLFQALTETFEIQSGLYPGSFAHITPSFFVPTVVYVDTDRRCPRFFTDPLTLQYVTARKQYRQPSSIRFHGADFSEELPEPDEAFDLLISLYAGFISQHCVRYLRPEGVLVVNNSHGDAPLAHLNPAYELVGVVQRRGERFKLSFDDLDAYFVTKAGKPLCKEEILKSRRGPAYTKSPYAYLFKKVTS